MQRDEIEVQFENESLLRVRKADKRYCGFMKESSLKWMFIVVMNAAAIGMGIIYSITGPTLPVLAEHLCESPDTVGWILAGRSAGVLIGSIICPFVDRTDKIGHVILIFFSCTVCGASLGIIPILTDLWIMILVISITGIMLGYIDAAIQVIILKVWGSFKSASIIQLHHFMFGFGAFIAPLIVNPFYEEVDDQVCTSGDDDLACGIDDDNVILVPFLIGMGWMLFASAGVLWLYFIDIVEKISVDEEVEVETRKEDSLRTLWPFFFFISVYYFCIVGAENTYQANLFSWAVCTEVGMEATDATVLNSIFWAGFILGRGAGVFVTRFITPGMYIIIDSVVITAASVVMLIWPADEIVLWCGTFFWGLGIATFYGSGITYASRLTNMSGKWFFIFALGNSIGNLSMPVLGTALVYSDNPNSYMIQMFAMAIGTVVGYIGMWYTGYKAKGSSCLPAIRKARDEDYEKNSSLSLRKSQVLPEKKLSKSDEADF